MNRKERRRRRSLASQAERRGPNENEANNAPRTLDPTPTLDTKVQKAASTTSRSLFHYTTAAGLVGILQTQSLFATHANFLNDSAECRILRELLKPELTREIAEIVPELIRQQVLKEEIYKEHGAKIHEMQAEKVLDSMFVALEKIAPFYICSFCLHDRAEPEYENGLLSQWRGYANGGFAIEFDELALDELAKRENATFQYQGLLTETVSYDDHRDRAKLDQFNGLGRAMLRVLFEDVNGDQYDFGKTRFESFTRPFLSILPFLKDPGFSEEREYRIAALCNRPGVQAPDDNRKPKKVFFRESKGGAVVPYIQLFAGLDEGLPIKGILIGPHSNQDNQATALQLLLDQCKIDATVRRSKLTFRQT
ncbi:DUF2971 domain-containing protein [Bradyrhizobium sp. INPA03-11B]|uniref:DUF2971 domain-containing protein n=1 Tax=Bradyrhizobium sp. INPA03-11B TaxID=418598 RepID=UPI00339014D2